MAGVRCDKPLLRLRVLQRQRPPSHLPSNGALDLTLGKAFGQQLTASLTVLNLTDRHLLIDNSLTFDGFHWNYPRQVYAALQNRFGY